MKITAFLLCAFLSMASIAMAGWDSVGSQGWPDCHDATCCQTWCGYMMYGPPRYTECVNMCICSYSSDTPEICESSASPKPTEKWYFRLRDL